MKLYNEFGEELKPYTEETYFNKDVYFEKEGENLPFIELTIDCSGISMVVTDEKNTFTAEQYEYIQKFAEEVKKHVIDNAKDYLDYHATRDYLMSERYNS